MYPCTPPASCTPVPPLPQVCGYLLLGIDFESGEYNKEEIKKLNATFFDGFYGLLPFRWPFTVFGKGTRAAQQRRAGCAMHRTSVCHMDAWQCAN